MAPDVDLVVPTSGRPTLRRLLSALASQEAGLPGRVLIVDDRPRAQTPLDLGAAVGALGDRFDLLASGGCGPAEEILLGWCWLSV
jgi:hypothetical protein